MEAIVIKVLASWTSAGCSCCPADMVLVSIKTETGEIFEVSTTLTSEGEILIFDKDEEFWIPLN